MDFDSDDEYLVNVIPPSVFKLKEDPSLNILKIEHTRLGEDGCRRLFRWLRTGIDWECNETVSLPQKKISESAHENNFNPRFPRKLSHLEMNNVAMNDEGFECLIDWLRCIQSQNQNLGQGLSEPVLQSLTLRNNKIHGTSDSARYLVSTLSSAASLIVAAPSISALCLSSNPLSAPFRQTLFSLLPKLSSLRSLQISLARVQPNEADELAVYFGDDGSKCKLTEFIASGNSMGYRGVKTIIGAMEHNWSLEKVNMYSNMSSNEGEIAEYTKDQADYDRLMSTVEADFAISQEEILTLAWGSGGGELPLTNRLKTIIGRNILYKKQVKKQALDLLKYSRQMLYKTTSPPGSSSTTSSSNAPAISPTGMQYSSVQYFSFLPTEIQLVILSETAPLLSASQRIRIFEYAADKATLPKLRLCFPSRDAGSSSKSKSFNADPANLAFNSESGKKVGKLQPRGEARRSVCAGGNCFGSDSVLRCRHIERNEWLELVGCDAYDPGDTV